ncbi:MAG: hypothetical protein WCI67_19545 [Chloroflexales bacterium]
MPTPTIPPGISVSISAAKHYDPNSMGNVGLYISARVYTSIGGVGVAGKMITFHVSYIYGGVTFNYTVTLGPTDASGFAKACPAGNYPANVQINLSSDAVNNAPGPNGPAQSNIQVQNQGVNVVPSFCP